MIPLLAVMAQAAAPQTGDFWGKLLGIDRVDLSSDADKTLEWHHLPPAWVLILLIIPAILVLVGAIYRGERKDVGVGPKVVLTALRSLGILLILLLLMGPVLTITTIKSRKSYLIALIDESRSMQKVDLLQTPPEIESVSRVTGVTGADDVKRLSRADIVKKVLENPDLRILKDLEEKLNVAYFTFSSTAVSKENKEKLFGPGGEYRREACIGAETAIGDAIKASLNSLKGQYVVGVLLFSDGKNNAGMATREIAAQLKQRYLPIYAVAAGVPHTPKDVALAELEAQDAVLANDALSVSFKVSSFGYDNETVNVGVWIHTVSEKEKDFGNDPKDLDRIVEQSRKEKDHPVTLKGRQEKQPQKVDFAIKTPGDYLLVLRVDPRADENTAHNNYLTHRFRVADDKIKVLYVEHPPRYEYRFLKNALVRDSKILVHCLLTSADEGFPQEHSKSSEDPLFKQPIQEFPRDLKSLLEFDVVIFGDCEPGRLGPEAAKNLETFVSEFGGGVIFISGTHYNPRALVNTPLANLLPVVPDDARDLYEHEKIHSQMYGYQLTPDGRKHPITTFKEFKGDEAKNTEHWEDRAPPRDGLVGIRWFQKVKKLKAGATPLVELTGVQGEASRPPLFVTQHVGRGRVFWSATDETWLWRYLVGDYPWFYPFWQQAMYWTRQGKLLGARRYRVSVDKERYTRGEPVKIYALAYDEKYEPRQDEKITVFLDPPSGDILNRVQIPLDRDKTRSGWYEGSHTPDGTGLYKVWAGDDDESSRASAKFTIFIPDREDDDPKLDIETLEELAKGSYQGRFFRVDQVGELNSAINRSDNLLRETKEDDLWDSPLVYLVFALLITAEWILRKIFRML